MTGLIFYNINAFKYIVASQNIYTIAIQSQQQGGV